MASSKKRKREEGSTPPKKTLKTSQSSSIRIMLTRDGVELLQTQDPSNLLNPISLLITDVQRCNHIFYFSYSVDLIDKHFCMVIGEDFENQNDAFDITVTDGKKIVHNNIHKDINYCRLHVFSILQ